MTPDVVVDIGNTRMKWGRCEGGRVAEVLRLPLDEPAVWDAELAKLPPSQSAARRWAVASVNPPACERFVAWAGAHGTVTLFTSPSEVPIRVNVDEPGKVGLDRLFGAVAAKAMVPPGTPVITVDVGTAVTVNVIDAGGLFQGGAIFPGPRLMGRALNDHTAKLPLIDLGEVPAAGPPGRNTAGAIAAGIAAAVQGGVGLLVERLAARYARPRLFITGGARGALSRHLFRGVDEVTEVPELTLEGIRIAAGALQ
ncbi:type III pantothenate kinase [Gemmata sp.]|uniref:type III pantothenate kinase n=1 Tax=Gemmata sp. TaxID=1914242 RepID=UPI003F7186DA